MKSKNLRLALIGGLLIGQTALADLSKPQPLQGFYVGISIGHANMDINGTHEDVTPFIPRQDRINRDYNENFFGGNVGYGWYNGSRFKGVELDISQFSDSIDDYFIVNNPALDQKEKVFFVTNERKFQISGLYGNQFDNGLLLYGRLGLVYTDIEVASVSVVINNPALEDGVYSGSVHDWIGGVTGVGLAYPLSDHWSIRGEYNYTTYFIGPEYDNDKNDGEITDYDLDDHRLLIGLSYSF